MSTKVWLCFVSILCFDIIGKGEGSFGYELIEQRLENLDQKLSNLDTSLYDRLTRLEKNSNTILSLQKSSDSQINNIKTSISTLESQNKQILNNHFDLVIPSCGMTNISGVYRLQAPNINVFCNSIRYGGGWLVIQQRLDGEVDFNHGIYQYQVGFGTVGLYSDFWLGLEAIHQITSNGEYELHISLFNEFKEMKIARYSIFKVASKADGYRLTVGGYSGTAGDSLGPHNNMKFSANNWDNDESTGNCAEYNQSGWWFKNCGAGNLNGPFKKASNGYGIEWGTFANACTFSRMMIRRK